MSSRLAALLLGVTMSLACGEDASSGDDADSAGASGGTASGNGGASMTGGTAPNGGTTGGTGTGDLGGSAGSDSGGAPDAGMSSTAGTDTGGQSGSGSGGSAGTGTGGSGGSGGWLCQTSNDFCTCGPVTEPNADDCGEDWSCCIDYVSVIDEVEREVCACDETSDADCSERAGGLLHGRRETTCPP